MSPTPVILPTVSPVFNSQSTNEIKDQDISELDNNSFSTWSDSKNDGVCFDFYKTHHQDPYDDYDCYSSGSELTGIINSKKNPFQIKDLKGKGHHIIELPKKNGKRQSHEFYETFLFPKTTIRNAITGERYNGFHVGTRDENLFFKVIDATAPVKNKDPYILFYENPEQWEHHTNQICSPKIKMTWNAKCQEAIVNYKMKSKK